MFLRAHAKPVKDVLLLPALPYTKREVQTSSKLESSTEADGQTTRRMDAVIAAIAINHGAFLYTFNVKHFKHLEGMGLKLFLTSLK